jgi:hypothetical protein
VEVGGEAVSSFGVKADCQSADSNHDADGDEDPDPGGRVGGEGGRTAGAELGLGHGCSGVPVDVVVVLPELRYRLLQRFVVRK